jgi:hypothetical protein
MATLSSFLPWRQLRNELRLIPLDDATHLIVDGGDVVHAVDVLPDRSSSSGLSGRPNTNSMGIGYHRTGASPA